MLDNYILETKKYLELNPNLTEDEIVMHVYLDLGYRLSFDTEFFFCDSKRKSEIYYNASKMSELNNCLKNNRIICKSSAYILEYILKSLGVNIVTVVDCEGKGRKEGVTRIYAHVYNVIIPSDGSKSYIIDLQNDLSNIHFHFFTTYFGKDVNDNNKYVISPNRIKQIQTKLGYVSDSNPYLDDYVEQFKFLPKDLSFLEKADIILKDIEPHKFENVSYFERRWKHDEILKRTFINVNATNRINTVEFYKKIGDDFIYNNGYYVFVNKGIVIYYYNIDTYQYESYNVEEFAHKVIEEDICYFQKIRILDRKINELKGISKGKVKKI